MSTLTTGLVFLGAAVVAVPIFKRLKLGAILGYLVAGLIIGPSALNLVSDPYTILHFAAKRNSQFHYGMSFCY